MSAKIPILQVDSFTAERFRGNPAGVCLLPQEADADWMQAVAAEMNLSETAFVTARGNNEFSLRWFTPTVEVPLCGHATLASAHVLWEDERAALDTPIKFHAPKGLLTAQRESDWICLGFPALPVEEADAPAGLAEALGCSPVGVYQSPLPAYLVDLGSEKNVRQLQPDVGRLSSVGAGRCIVTARSDDDSYDLVSRFFAPDLGINEDPVTGSAHCSLGPFWAERLGQPEVTGHQVSKRGGVVKVRVRGDRVQLLGQAVTVIRGDLIS